MKRIVWISSLWILVALLAAFTVAYAQDDICAYVNGEAVTTADVEETETLLMETYEAYGIDITDEEIIAHAWEEALSQQISETVIRQYITENGLDVLSETETEELQAIADAAWDYLLETNVEENEFADYDDNDELLSVLTEIAEGYYNYKGYSKEWLISELNDYYASQHLVSELMEDYTLSENELAEMYAEQSVQDEEIYAQASIMLYEYMLYYDGTTIIYTPDGYRGIVQILLEPDEDLLSDYVTLLADEDADENDVEAACAAVLDSVADTVDEIYAALNAGEDFGDLIGTYGTDSGMEDDDYFENGYPVHAESIIYDETWRDNCFSEELSEPGDVGNAFVTQYGVHILQYKRDVPSGLAAYEDCRDDLYNTAYSTELSTRYAEKTNALIEAAEIEYVE